MEILVRGAINLQGVEQQRHKFLVSTHTRKSREQFADKAAERRRIHPALLSALGHVIQQRVNRKVLSFRRAVSLEDGGNRLLDREQAQSKIDERIKLLDLRFERRDAILLIVSHGYFVQ